MQLGKCTTVFENKEISLSFNVKEPEEPTEITRFPRPSGLRVHHIPIIRWVRVDPVLGHNKCFTDQVPVDLVKFLQGLLLCESLR